MDNPDPDTITIDNDVPGNPPPAETYDGPFTIEVESTEQPYAEAPDGSHQDPVACSDSAGAQIDIVGSISGADATPNGGATLSCNPDENSSGYYTRVLEDVDYHFENYTCEVTRAGAPPAIIERDVDIDVDAQLDPNFVPVTAQPLPPPPSVTVQPNNCTTNQFPAACGLLIESVAFSG